MSRSRSDILCTWAEASTLERKLRIIDEATRVTDEEARARYFAHSSERGSDQRFMGGSDRNKSNSGRSGDFVSERLRVSQARDLSSLEPIG
jgi:hypothetical protein